MKFTKPKFWDLEKTSLIAYLLYPLTVFIRISNLIFDLKTKEINKNIKSICIGNIYVGGTGKTPSTIKLYKILKNFKIRTVVGKKFYKSQIDETIILKRQTNLIVGKNRKKINNLAIKKKYDVIIYDDGLQDKTLDYDIKIVCFDAQNWVGNNFLIPSGPLREKVDSLKKYDCVFLKGDKTKASIITRYIKKLDKDIKVFNTDFKVVNLKKFKKNNKYLIYSGIGNPENFKKTLLNNKLNIIKEIIFPDHYKYKIEDIKQIKQEAKQIGAKIITTEKDYVKLPRIEKNNINFLKVELKIKNEKQFVSFLKSKIYD